MESIKFDARIWSKSDNYQKGYAGMVVNIDTHNMKNISHPYSSIRFVPLDLYYFLKPLLPQLLWHYLRKKRIDYIRKRSYDIWPIDRNAAKKPEGWLGWPDGKRFAFVLTHDVETAKGQQKCRLLAELEMRLDFRSSFNFVAEDYDVDSKLRSYLIEQGFEVGVHGLKHRGNMFRSEKTFLKQVPRINRYLREWDAVGFRAPSMFRNLQWLENLNIEYDSSSFDTDPFEPQPDGVRKIFPFIVQNNTNWRGYVELPYTLPQDSTLFISMKENSIDIWKQKLDWIAENGGMALLNVHPDYMRFDNGKLKLCEYPVKCYEKFLEYVESRYHGQYCHMLPKDMGRYWKTVNSKRSEALCC